MSKKAKKALIPLALLAVGLAGAMLLASAREAPPRRPARTLAPLVEALEVTQDHIPVVVTGQGTVQPRTAIQVVPQVPGRVVATHPNLAAGGFFRRGEVLVAIEPADYELAVERAEATVAGAEVRLETERAEAAVARQEWDRLHPGEEPPNALVLRAPQVHQAEAELAAAEADLAAARLNLERTRIRAPFDGRVVSETVDTGQYVVAGQPVAHIYATDVLEVPVPLEDAELAWFDTGGGRGGGAPTEVAVDFAGARHVWRGRVVRSEGVDPESRMVNVVVAVEDGYVPGREKPPLEPGMFVEVGIEGHTLEGAVPLPREAVHGGDEVWVVEDGLLRIRRVKVARTARELAYVADGLAAGDLVVTTNLDAVTDGMPVRVAGEGGTSPEAESDEGGRDPEAAAFEVEAGEQGRTA